MMYNCAFVGCSNYNTNKIKLLYFDVGNVGWCINLDKRVFRFSVFM